MTSALCPDSFETIPGHGDFPLLEHSGVSNPVVPWGRLVTLCMPLSFSAPLPVGVAFRRGPSIVSPQRTIRLKTNACVITSPNLQNSENVAKRPARSVTVGEWMTAGRGESFS